METFIELGKRAKQAAGELAILQTEQKNKALFACAEALISASAELLAANKEDMEAAKKAELPETLLRHLLLNEERIKAMADALKEIAALKDPVGEVLSMSNRPNGMMVGKMRSGFALRQEMR